MPKSEKKKSNERNSLDFYEKRDRALERVIAAYEKGETADEDELNRALDALAVAHISATFEWASGPLEQQFLRATYPTQGKTVAPSFLLLPTNVC